MRFSNSSSIEPGFGEGFPDSPSVELDFRTRCRDSPFVELDFRMRLRDVRLLTCEVTDYLVIFCEKSAQIPKNAAHNWQNPGRIQTQTLRRHI